MSANVEEVVVTARNFPNVLALPVSGSIGDLKIETTINEVLTDEVEITDHPIQSGAETTDHAYEKPCVVILQCGWSNSSLAAAGAILRGALGGGTMARGDFAAGSKTRSDYVGGIYSQLLAFKKARAPLSITTSLREYDNMLIQSLKVEIDQKTSQVLLVRVALREIFIVSTQSATLPPQQNQANPASTAEVQNAGPKQVTPASPSPGGAVPSAEWTH